MRKICLAGPSGSGKTTLAKYIASKEMGLGIEYVPSSASIVLGPRLLQQYRAKYGYKPDGHANVINMSCKMPDFGYQYQKDLLNTRTEQIMSRENIVMDRSPVDNFTYFVSQCSFNVSQELSEQFLNDCLLRFKLLSHFIYVRTSNPGKIEDNGSRVPNYYFQRAIDAIFHRHYQDHFSKITSVKQLVIDYWDLDTRKNHIKRFLYS